MNAADTVVTVLVPATDVPASSVSVCGECFGWGFVWAEVAAGEPMPGADCRSCRGTGVSW